MTLFREWQNVHFLKWDSTPKNLESYNYTDLIHLIAESNMITKLIFLIESPCHLTITYNTWYMFHI